MGGHGSGQPDGSALGTVKVVLTFVPHEGGEGSGEEAGGGG